MFKDQFNTFNKFWDCMVAGLFFDGGFMAVKSFLK